MSKALISVLAGLGGMLGWGTSDFFANLSSDKIGHSKTVFWSQLAGIFALGLLTIFVPVVFVLTPQLLGVFVIAAFSYIIGYLYFYKAFEIGNVSVVSAAINLNVVIAMLLAMIFKGQRLAGTQSIAVLLILLGVTLVAINIKDLLHSKVSLLSGVRETIIASFAFGAYWNLSEYLAETTGWLPASFWVKVIAVAILVTWSIYQKEKLGINENRARILPLVILVGLLEAFAVASVNFGLSVGDVVLVSPISSALSIVTIGLAVVFLKERLTKIQVFGIALAISGIVLSAF